jgi:hypothetical protein
MDVYGNDDDNLSDVILIDMNNEEAIEKTNKPGCGCNTIGR